MSAWFVGLIALLYLGAGISLLNEGKLGLSLFCFGCVIANIGLVMTTK